MERNFEEIARENERRKKLLQGKHDPDTGEGCCGKRKRVRVGGRYLYLPEPMIKDRDYKRLAAAVDEKAATRMHAGMRRMEFEKLRCRYDFEFWAWRCTKIKDKVSGRSIAFILNNPQRKLLAVMEDQRLKGEPIRVILLKARQWGGSTLTQLYFAWLQLVKAKGKNLLICAHVKNSAAVIRQMYSQILKDYPASLWEGDKGSAKERQKGFQAQTGATDTRVVPGRDSTVTIASSFAQDTVRGLDISLAHLSEVAYWMDSPKLSPEAFIRAVCSGISQSPMTGIVMESTANGTGNFFHTEWLRSKNGESDKRAVFVAWHEIEMYRKEVKDVGDLWNSMDGYERSLWEQGLTLEMIQWYHDKRKEAPDHSTMMTEFPTDDTEAFVHTGQGVFAASNVDAMMGDCRQPLARGELAGDLPTGGRSLEGLRFREDPTGCLKVWEFPSTNARDRRDRYVVAVDVGGRTATSDWSVIAVIDRGESDGSGPMRIAAQWRGHTDHDLLGWKAAQIAKWYGEALLVVESNTLEHESAGSTSYILEELRAVYPRLYARTVQDEVTMRKERKYGFHTNRATKATIISCLISLVREHGYAERDIDACRELMTYRQLPSGSYAARQGCHDDILMTRAIGLYVALTVPRVIDSGCSELKEQVYF